MDCVFEVKLQRNGLLKKITEAIKDILNDINLECSPRGFSLQAIDQSHIALVSFLLTPEEFEYFRCERSITLGIKLSSLYKILKCVSNEDSVIISYKSSSDVLLFLFENSLNDRITEFELRLIHIKAQNLSIPNAEYSNVVYLTAAEYKRICCDMSLIGDLVLIEAFKTGVKFEIEGMIGKGSVVLLRSEKKENEILIESVKNDKVSMYFPLKHLIGFTKAAPLCKKIILRMSKNTPLQLEFKIGTGGYIRYYLAPRMQDQLYV